MKLNLLIPLLLILTCYSGVLQITLNNLKNVLTSLTQIHILFHNPQCIHSRKYSQTFLKLQSKHNLGMVDCLRQTQLCSKYNLTMFPLLMQVRQNEEGQVNSIVDQQGFLVEHQIKQQDNQQVLVNLFVSYLQGQGNYAVVVFEHQGLSCIDSQRISKSQQNILYLQPYSLQNPSNLTKILSSMVSHKPGCWIFSNSPGMLQKYYCDSGYSSQTTLKYISLFKEQKLKPTIFQSQPKQSNLNSNEFYNMIQKIQQNDKNQQYCRLVYIFDKRCKHCKDKDFQMVNWVIGQIGIKDRMQLLSFDIQDNQIPQTLIQKGFKRVPELVYCCNNRIRIFGETFFIKNISKFIRKQHLGQLQYDQQSKADSSKKIVQQQEL